MLYKRRFSLEVVGWVLILCALSLIPTSPMRAAPDAPLDTPIPVVTEGFNEWTLNEGLLYWADRCYGGEFVGPGYLRRKPANGGTTRTLSTVTEHTCYTFMNLTATADGLYYYDGDAGGIYFRPVDSPYDPPTLVRTVSTNDAPAGASRMAVDGDYIYWMVDTLSGTDTIRRARTDGSGVVEMVVQPATNPKDLAVVNGVVYWLDQNGLQYTTTTCDSLPCAAEQLVNTRGTSMMYYNPGVYPIAYQIYWVKPADTIDNIPSSIHRYSCIWQLDPLGITCSEAKIYTASSTAWMLGRLTTNGTQLFWPERRDPLDPSPDGKLKRMPLGGGTADDIASNMLYIDTRVFSDNFYVYFAQFAAGDDIGIYKLPFDASPIVRDLDADDLEVTQGIQNMANDVPLIAQKPTYVRGYASQNSGPDAVSVEAWLHGTRDGSSLPGSPLYAVNGMHPLAAGDTYDRGVLDESWLFRLPDSWITEGSITLRLEIDPREQYSDPNRGNNEYSDTFTFNAKAPVCTVFVPVRTHSPNYNSPTDNPNFWAMYDVAERLWPAYDFWAYEQSEDIAELQVCWWGPFPYPCFGPYEIPDDTWKILTSLNTRDFFSDDPDECDNLNGKTHYIGMVHPDTNTSTSDGTVLGTAYRNDNVAWVKFEPHSFTPTDDPALPDAGATLAHEMGHNLGRKHVDCGGPDGVDSGYPYTTTQIADVGQNSYYGFDIRTHTVIPPDGAKDIMSYCRPYWTSDYTWRALNNRISSSSVVPAAQPVRKLAPGDAVFVTGSVTPTENTGVLNYAWVYPAGGLSTGILRKWESIAALPLEVSGLHPQSASAVSYTLRLYDAQDAVLATYPLTMSETVDDEVEVPVSNFSLTFSDPGNVARVELLADDTPLDSRAPGGQAPSVTFIAPQGGETFNDTLTLIWEGTDADADDTLLYNVQYSNDDGTTWRVVVNNYPAPDGGDTVTLTLSTQGLPGSDPNQARLRVAASDGYHTGMATSEGFTIPDHAPRAFILPPTTTPAGLPVTLRGGAMDAEDGAVTGSALSWEVDGDSHGTGQEVLAAGLAPGLHTATLTAEDSAANTGIAQANVIVPFLHIPQGDAPQLDGFCDDAFYTSGAQLRLAPYGSAEGQAAVHIARSSDDLWACFSGMKTGEITPGAFAGLRFDVDSSKDALAQTDDYAFFVGEDGGYFSYAGDGSGGFDSEGPGGVQAMVSAYTDTWSAELRIDASVLGGWDHVVGMNVGHYWVEAQGDDYVWPYSSTWNQPDTWATTVLGQAPTVFLPIIIRD